MRPCPARGLGVGTIPWEFMPRKFPSEIDGRPRRARSRSADQWRRQLPTPASGKQLKQRCPNAGRCSGNENFTAPV